LMAAPTQIMKSARINTLTMLVLWSFNSTPQT
jgi:hypothetical protein